MAGPGTRYSVRRSRNSVRWSRRAFKCNHGCTPPACFGRRIVVAVNVVALCKYRAHNFAVNSDASAVDDADNGPTPCGHFLKISFNCGLYIARRERVQVQRVFDWKLDRFGVVHIPQLIMPPSADRCNGAQNGQGLQLRLGRAF